MPGTRVAGITNTTTGSIADAGPLAWEHGVTYLVRETIVGDAYDCRVDSASGTLGSYSTNRTFSPPTRRAAVFTSSIPIRVDWLLLLEQPDP